MHFGVRGSGLDMIPLPDTLIMLNNYTADTRVWRGGITPFGRQLNGFSHPEFIGGRAGIEALHGI
jgi:hypothetical protein